MGLNIAVLAIGEAMSIDDEPPAALVVERLTQAGHKIGARAVVPDSLQMIRAKFLEYIADPTVDVVIATAGTRTEYAAQALAPLVTKQLAGFADLFRLMTFEEIGTAAMLVDAEAAQCKTTFVFLLPASIGAVRTALEKLIAPQLDYRTKPQNLVMRMPRIAHVDTPEKAPEPEPWITPKKPTQTIAAVPAPAKPAPRPATIPPPIPAIPSHTHSVSQRLAAIPQFMAKETTAVGPAPAPRNKVSTIVAPLPMKAPAAPIVPMTEDASTPEREKEVEDRPGPIPHTPPPSVMIDASLEDKATIPIPINRRAETERVWHDDDDDDGYPRRVIYPRHKGVSATFVVTWIVIAVAAAAAVLFMLMRKEDDEVRREQVASRTPVVAPEVTSEPPTPTPPPPPVVEPPPVAPVVDDEIDMAAPVDEPAPATNPFDPPPAAKPKPPKAPKEPVVTKDPAVAKEPVVAKAPVEKPPLDDGCDEVSCVLDRYRLPCCATFKPAEEAPKPVASGVPEKIDRAMILDGIGPMKPAVQRCGEKFGGKGTVKLVVQVLPSGNVDDITVSTTPDEALGSCVASAVKKATFGKTQSGGSFGYPFVF